MDDVKISAGYTIAYTLWFLVVAGMIVASVFDLDHLGRASLALAAAAATAHIRQFFVVQNKMLRNAFELGRDHAESRRLR